MIEKTDEVQIDIANIARKYYLDVHWENLYGFQFTFIQRSYMTIFLIHKAKRHKHYWVVKE